MWTLTEAVSVYGPTCFVTLYAFRNSIQKRLSQCIHDLSCRREFALYCRFESAESFNLIAQCIIKLRGELERLWVKDQLATFNKGELSSYY